MKQETATLVNNGKIINFRSSSTFNEVYSVIGGGKLIIGQDQDTFGGSFDPSESTIGEIADLKLYATTLDINLMKDYSVGSMKHEINQILSFDTFDEFINSNALYYEVKTVDIFFQQQVPFLKLFSQQRSFKDADKICRSMKGSIATPKKRRRKQRVVSSCLYRSRILSSKHVFS